jgi:CheY-like chemotaxis protein
MESTILVVEDDPHLRGVITEVLSDEGYAVYEACDGLGALERIGTVAPDLVVSDVRMPRLDGLELAERLGRMDDPIPVLLMSAGINAPRDIGASFLAKPFMLDDLVTLVERILSTRGGRGAVRRPLAFAF